MSESQAIGATSISPDVCLLLRDRLEAHLLRGCREVAFVPDGEVGQSLAALTRDNFQNARSHFIPPVLIEDSSGAEDRRNAQSILKGVDVVVVCVDAEKLRVLAWLNSLDWDRFPAVVVAGVGHQMSSVNIVSMLERGCPVPSHATGYDFVKAHLYDALRYLRHRQQEGVIAEMGTFRGGTLMLIEQMLQELNYLGPQLVGFDTFSGFPPRRRLLDMFAMDRFEDRDYEAIRDRLGSRGIEVVRGDIVDTSEWLATKNLLLTFFDTDNYSATAATLPLCFNRTVAGGIIIFDHYYTRSEYFETIGECVAAEEFFRDRKDYIHLSGTGVFLKVPFLWQSIEV